MSGSLKGSPACGIPSEGQPPRRSATIHDLGKGVPPRTGAREGSGMNIALPKYAIFPILILILSSVVGFTWGMPARWNPDSLVLHVVEMRNAGTLEPYNYKYPGLYIYALYFLTRPFEGDALITATFVVARLL